MIRANLKTKVMAISRVLECPIFSVFLDQVVLCHSQSHLVALLVSVAAVDAHAVAVEPWQDRCCLQVVLAELVVIVDLMACLAFVRSLHEKMLASSAVVARYSGGTARTDVTTGQVAALTKQGMYNC